MHLYTVQPDPAARQFRNSVEAVHKWGLPGIICPVCGATWALSGVAYPSVDVGSLADPSPYTSYSPVPLDRFLELRREVFPLVPDGRAPPPGTQFGPLVGKLLGEVGDFAWVNPWTMLLREGASER